jgi:F-type H+-transporting ATPase subunit b
MLIDWFTVGAQAFNFLILVWLMKRFLYRPILNAIDEREKRIAKVLNDADIKKAEAQKEREDYQHKIRQFDQQHDELLAKAMAEVEAERKRLLNDVRQTADGLSAKRQEMLRNDARNLNQAISCRVQQEVFDISRKVLADLATTSLEGYVAEDFIRRLRKIDMQAKQVLTEALKSSSEPGIVRSAFGLSEGQCLAIENAINETVLSGVQLRFEVAPELICGVEWVTNGQKVAWSISDYLVSLEQGIEGLLKNKPIAHVGPKPDQNANE